MIYLLVSELKDNKLKLIFDSLYRNLLNQLISEHLHYGY